MTVPKAIFLDAGHTLIEASPSPVVAYRQVALKEGADDHTVEELWEILGPKMRELFEKRNQFSHESSDAIELAFWKELIHFLIEHFDPWKKLESQSLLQKLWQHFGQASNWQCYPESHEVLEKIKAQGISLALVSNWDTRLRQILEELNLSPHFEVISISAEVGWRKPHANIFKETLEKLNLEPHQAWHVGDSLSDDVQGAMEFGLTPIFLDRLGHNGEVDSKRIGDLNGLLDLLK